MDTSPIFVVFEGLDGAGKTTASKAVAESLGAHWMTTPSDSVRKFRNEIVESFAGCQEAAQLFYLATVFDASRRAEQLLRTGTSVVMDRYFLSTQAYAAFRGSSVGLDDVGEFLTPAHLTVFIDAELSIRSERLRVRGLSAADRETLESAADSTIRREHLSRRHLKVCGQFERIDTGVMDRGEVVARVAELCQLVRTE